MELLALLFILAFATAVLLSRNASYRESRWAMYHHLFEYGTMPIFVTIGRLHRAPFVHDDGSVGSREVFTLRYTYDERIEDGFYAARASNGCRRCSRSRNGSPRCGEGGENIS